MQQQIKVEVEGEEKNGSQEESVLSNVAVTIYGSPSPPEFKKDPEIMIENFELDLDDPSPVVDAAAAAAAAVKVEKEKGETATTLMPTSTPIFK